MLKGYSKDPFPENNGEYSVFWEHIKRESIEYGKYMNDKSNFARNSANEFFRIVSRDKPYLPELDMREVEMMRSFVGHRYTKYIKRIIVEQTDELNAGATPNGIIYITRGIANEMDANQRCAIIAHEIAHIVLKHSEIHYYARKKIEKNNEKQAILAGSLAAIAGYGSMLYAADSYAKAGISYDFDAEQFNNTMQNIGNAIDTGYKINAMKRKYEYSREQEMEADIVACMFLKWVGKEPVDLISALKKLDPAYTISEYDTHPSLMFRISVLNKIFYPDKQNIKSVRKYTDPCHVEIQRKSFPKAIPQP
jgi:Zn-dependent protease with chaperone function